MLFITVLVILLNRLSFYRNTTLNIFKYSKNIVTINTIVINMFCEKSMAIIYIIINYND